MKTVLLLAFGVFLIPACNRDNSHIMKVADKLHGKILTIDTHCDTPMEMIRSDFDLGVRHEDGCVDFPRMAEGGLDAEFFAVFTSQGPRNDSAFQVVYKETLEALDVIHRNIEKNSQIAGIAVSPDDAYRLKKAGKRAAFIGIENGYPVGKDLSKVKELYNRGARYITLSHTRNNDICDSSTDPAGPEHDGLSDFGKELVAEMNRLGMLVDVSHISDKAFNDVLSISKSPVIASHSSCRALCESPRNLTDNMLLALKENGGVIQICILSDYIKTPKPNPELDAKLGELRVRYGSYDTLPEAKRKALRSEYREIQNKYVKLATVKDVVDHIDHVVQVIGIDYVGIGSDFDGGGGVDGCKTVAEMKNITVELLQRGYSKSDIEKIWGGNFMRVFKEAEMLKDSNI